MRKVSSYKLIVIALGLMLVLGVMMAACGEEETETTAAPTETTAAPTETTAAPTETTAAGATGVVKVGMNAPLTGGAAAWGLPGMEGLTIITNWYNEAGGVKIGDTTYTFEIVEYDNQAIPDEALLGARKLVLEDGCSLILDLGGATSASMAPFLTEQKIPSFTLIAQDLKADRPYLFAVTDNFPTYHALNVRFIKETYPDAKKMAILSQDDEIGIAAVAWAEAGAEVDGLEVVYDEPFSLDTTDFAQIVTKVLASEPDIINLGACYPEYQALICEQAYLQGWEGIITSACWDFGAILAKVPKEFMEGSVSNFPDFDDPKLVDKGVFAAGKTYQEFWDTWKAEYPDSSYSEITWEYGSALDVWVWAAQQAGSIDGEAVSQALRAGKDVPRSFGTGNWTGMAYFGIDQLLAPTVPMTAIRDGKPAIEGWKNINDWMAEGDNAAILEKYLKKWNLSVQ